MTSIEENNHTLPKSMDRICKKHDKIISESIGMCSSCHRDYLMLARSEGIYSVIKKANEDFAQDILNRYFDENSETDVTSLHRELTDLIEGK